MAQQLLRGIKKMTYLYIFKYINKSFNNVITITPKLISLCFISPAGARRVKKEVFPAVFQKNCAPLYVYELPDE